MTETHKSILATILSIAAVVLIVLAISSNNASVAQSMAAPRLVQVQGIMCVIYGTDGIDCNL